MTMTPSNYVNMRLCSLFKGATLTFNLFKMGLRDKYMGSSLGMLWGILNPLILLGVYTFIFGFVFKAKIPGAETTLGYAIWLISGLVPYLAFNEGITSTANSIISGASLIKNVVFKAETLVYASALTSLIPLTVGLIFLVFLRGLDGALPSWHIVFLLPVIFAQILFVCGIGLFLAPFAVFVRDVLQIIPTVLMLLMFATPIFYTLESMPAIVAKITFFNPLYQISDSYRLILLHNHPPNFMGLLYLLGLALILNMCGLWFFKRLKGYFEIAL